MESPTLMLPTYRERPFTDADWVFGLPLSGYRMMAEFGAGAVRLLSARGTDVAHWFPEVVDALAALASTGHGIVDGELCVLDRAGRNDVARLHERALVRGYRPGCSRVLLCVQDLLMQGGQDVRMRSWRERRQLLRALITGGMDGLRVQQVMPVEGDWLHRQATALGRPVMHARRLGGAYTSGRSGDWLEIPTFPGQPAIPSMAGAT